MSNLHVQLGFIAVATLIALPAQAGTLAIDAPEQVLARCAKGEAAACLELGDAAEWAWANSVAAGAPEPQREVQALAAWHEACRLGLTAACDRVEAVRRARAGDRDDGSCERGWAPACALLPVQRLALVCTWAPDPTTHPACTQLPLHVVGTVSKVRAIESWGVQTAAGAWFGGVEERWGAGAEPVGAHGGELWWLRADGPTQPRTLLRLTPDGFVERPLEAEPTLKRDVVAGADALLVEAQVGVEQGNAMSRPALAPLDGAPLVLLGKRPASPAAVSATRMAWIEGGTPGADATVVWGTLAGVAEGKVNGRNPVISPDGRRLLLSRGADVVLVDLTTRAERRVGEGRAMAWGPDASWFVVSAPTVTRLATVTGKEIARFSGGVTDVVTGPGLVWMDDALFELQPNAWAPRVPTRDGALPLPRGLAGSPEPYPNPRNVDVPLRVETCDGAPADGFVVARSGWSDVVRDGRVTVPAAAAGRNADLIVGGAGHTAAGRIGVVGPTDAQALDFDATPTRWGGRGTVTLSLACRRALSAADAHDPRSRTAWGWRGRQIRTPAVLASLIPWPYTTSAPATVRGGSYGPLLTHAQGWFRSSVRVADGGVKTEHIALPTHALAVKDAAGVPYAGALAWVSLGELGGTWASADLQGTLVIPEGATVELAGHPELIDPHGEVVVGSAAPTPTRATYRLSGTWSHDAETKLRLPASLTSAELVKYAAVQVNATTVVARHGEGTVVWRVQGG